MVLKRLGKRDAVTKVKALEALLPLLRARSSASAAAGARRLPARLLPAVRGQRPPRARGAVPAAAATAQRMRPRLSAAPAGAVPAVVEPLPRRGPRRQPRGVGGLQGHLQRGGARARAAALRARRPVPLDGARADGHCGHPVRPQHVTPVEDAQERYDRVVSAALLGLSTFMHSAPADSSEQYGAGLRPAAGRGRAAAVVGASDGAPRGVRPAAARAGCAAGLLR